MRRTQRHTAPRRAPRLVLEHLEDRSLLSVSPALPDPDYTVSIAVVPNDTRFAEQWDLLNSGQSAGRVDADIDADAAWDRTTGSLKTVVAVIDTGIDYTHPDLYKNVWINQSEIPAGARTSVVDTDSDGLVTFWDLNAPANAGAVTDGNANGFIDGGDLLRDVRWADRVDTDGNGKVDDLIGWDFVNNDNDPFDDNSHGTHVSGTIGALSNNGLGVAGINWQVQIAGLKFLSASGSGAISGAQAALAYAVAEGIPISNNSWGGGGYSQSFFDTLSSARAAGHIFVAAAGNSASNNDAVASYPSNYALDNVVAVASTDRNDVLSSFSSYGATTVDLAAPGSAILSTVPGGYASYNGTSMATPHVTGVLALLKSAEPNLTSSQMVSRLLAGVDPISSLTGKVATGGRLNAQKVLAGSAPVDTTGPRIISAALGLSGAGVSSVRLTFSEAIDAATFTTADVTGLTGPWSGGVTGVAPVTGSNGTQFDVTFASQTTTGTYQFKVGPDVRDLAGNQMDQSGDGVVGQPNDVYAVTYSVTATSTTTFTNGTAAAIPDYTSRRGVGVLESTIVVGSDATISDLNVNLGLTHTYDGDLYITLRHVESGKTVTLVARRGGAGDNFTSTVFDDEATRAVSAGAAPFTGSFRPETLLSAFDGVNARGTWVLRIEDRAAADVGTLRSWGLVVQTGGGASLLGGVGLGQDGEAGPSNPSGGLDKVDQTFTGLGAWLQSRREDAVPSGPASGSGTDAGDYLTALWTGEDPLLARQAEEHGETTPSGGGDEQVEAGDDFAALVFAEE